MFDPAQDWLAPHPLWDQLLRLTPVHVLMFDGALICRYAAPLDDVFLGHPRDELLHRHVAEFFPPAANGMRPSLEQVARDGVPWSTSGYRYAHRSGDAETIHIWDITASPVRVDDHRGVLLTLANVLDLTEQLERFQRERDALQVAVEQLRRSQRDHDRSVTATAVHLRVLLTPICGYLQFLLRHPELRAQDALGPLLSDVLLSQVQELFETLRGLDYPPLTESLEDTGL